MISDIAIAFSVLTGFILGIASLLHALGVGQW